MNVRMATTMLNMLTDNSAGICATEKLDNLRKHHILRNQLERNVKSLGQSHPQKGQTVAKVHHIRNRQLLETKIHSTLQLLQRKQCTCTAYGSSMRRKAGTKMQPAIIATRRAMCYLNAIIRNLNKQ